MTGIFGPSSDGWTRPLLRAPTDDEFRTAQDVLGWAIQFYAEHERRNDTLHSACAILALAEYEASGK